ncbi:MAG: NAD(P)-dependent oxidoreductase [Lentisphaerae bacterium]|jgi:nucleoside-diphosphate-sugar epimerase|nr:NAD(P)-dependent oxidoreductase [Lentisphaerota bacterium]
MLNNLPEKIANQEQLDELQSRPSQRLIEMMQTLDGDVMVIGATGKIGPHVVRMACRAVQASGVSRRVYAVARSEMTDLEQAGATTIRCDLLDPEAVARLPRVRNVIFLVGFKFGAESAKSMTWAVNVLAPYHVARHFQGSRIVVFSTGCVYPVMSIRSGGATEDTPPEPVGEYAQSCLGRERMFDVFADQGQEEVVHFRLNYAVECRYGVLYDVASKVMAGTPIDLTTGYANVIWQGDVCNQSLLAFSATTAPATILNVTGPEMFSIRQVALEFGRLMKRTPVFSGEENGFGYLSNSTRAAGLFGYPQVPLATLIRWAAAWILDGGASLGKPTHFETQDGKY